jgi:hypothetical protein
MNKTKHFWSPSLPSSDWSVLLKMPCFRWRRKALNRHAAIYIYSGEHVSRIHASHLAGEPIVSQQLLTAFTPVLIVEHLDHAGGCSVVRRRRGQGLCWRGMMTLRLLPLLPLMSFDWNTKTGTTASSRQEPEGGTGNFR